MEVLNWFLNEEVNLLIRIFLALQVFGFLYFGGLVLIIRPLFPEAYDRHREKYILPHVRKLKGNIKAKNN